MRGLQAEQRKRVTAPARQVGQRKAERAGQGGGAERIPLHKIFGTASKTQASWERGLRGFQTTLKMNTGEV